LSDDQDLEYRLDDQVGYILRRVYQRHTGIFAKLMPEDLTPTRFAAMVKLLELGTLSQNELGRQTSMDIATIKGVVDRLKARNFAKSQRDPKDGRRQMISLTSEGKAVVENALPFAKNVTEKTIANLSPEERIQLIGLLKKLC